MFARSHCCPLSCFLQTVFRVYIENTSCPVDGWFQPCDTCRAMTGNTVNIGGHELPVCRRCAKDAISAYGDQEKAVYADDRERSSCRSVSQHGSEASTPTGSDVSSTTAAISPQEDIVWALDWSWWTGGCVANSRVAVSMNNKYESAGAESRASNDTSPCSASEQYSWNCL